jgi:hypothetical protein
MKWTLNEEPVDGVVGFVVGAVVGFVVGAVVGTVVGTEVAVVPAVVPTVVPVVGPVVIAGERGWVVHPKRGMRSAKTRAKVKVLFSIIVPSF